MTIEKNQTLLETMSVEDKQLYIHRVFTMCVEMSNTSKMMREVGEDIDIIQLVENTTMTVLNYIYNDTYQLEQIMLEDKIINKDKIHEYSNFLND
jgi:hypothetical protein